MRMHMTYMCMHMHMYMLHVNVVNYNKRCRAVLLDCGAGGGVCVSPRLRSRMRCSPGRRERCAAGARFARREPSALVLSR
jgi:hypothetical protein